MAALSRRDIEMIFRADTDRATRPIGDLGKAAKTARGQLEDLTEAAARGEVSLDKLGETTRDLKKAQDELGTARSLLTQLNAQEAAVEKAGEKAQAAAKKYAELKAQVDGAEQPTKRLVNSMEAAGRASQAAADRLEETKKQAAAVREEITAVIGPVDNVGDAFREIATTSAEIARGLAVAGQAADDFKQRMNEAARIKLDDEKFAVQADRSPLMQEQIAYISQFENRVQMLKDAEQAQASAQREAASADVLAKARQKDALDSILAGNDALTREINEMAAAAERAENITAYKQIAADARASAADVARFGVTQDAVAESGRRFAQSLSMILNPSAAVNRTVEGIEESVRAADAALREGSKSAADYNVILNDLSQSGAAIERLGRGMEQFRNQQSVLDQAGARFREATAEVQRLAAAIERADEPTAEMARELRVAETAAESAGAEMQRQATRAQELGDALRRAGIDVRDLAQAEKQLEQAARQTAAASTEIRGKQGGAGGFLGLSPTDATNLSYQLNDIFTQLASGQSIFITLAQQGPQIWQIGGVQKYLVALKGLLIPLGAVAVGLGLVAGAAAAVNKATSPDANTQAGSAYLAMLGESANITAAQFGEAANRLEDFGLKAEEAQAVVKEFTQAGLDPSYLESYTQALRDAADATGTDMADAAGVLSAALAGGYDEVVKLNEQFPVLTDAEMAQVQAMYDSGNADEARQLIFDRFTQKMADAAAQMNGPWTNAWRNLQAAAASFGDYLATKLDGILAGARRRLDEVAIGVNYLLLRMRGLDAAAAGNAAVNNQGRAPSGPPGRGSVRPTPRSTVEGKKAADDAEREAKAKGATARLEDKIANARIKARREGQAKGYGSADIARLEAIAVAEIQEAADAKAAKAGAAAAKKAKSARDKAAREAESAAKRIANQAEQLENALDAMGVKVAKTSAGTLEEQLTTAAVAVDRQYAKLARDLDEYNKATGGKGKIGNLSIADYRAQVDANKTVLSNQAKLKVYEDALNDTLQQRKALLADIEERAQRGQIDSAQAIRDTAEVTSRFEPVIGTLTTAAVSFARSIAGANPSPELQAFIAKMESATMAGSGDNQADVRKAANANVGREESRLNQILSERNSLVEAYNTLQELGLITSDEARRKSADAYNASKSLIDTQMAALRDTIVEAQKLGAISPQAFAAFEAKLAAIGAQAEYLDPRFAQLKQGLDNIVTQNAMTGINTIAEAFGNALAGTESWGDALKAAGRALLDFIAQTIRNVAQLIIQMIILDAVQKSTGIPVAALLGTTAPGGGATGGGLFGFLGRLFHAGGVVGDGGKAMRSTRMSNISPAAIYNAPRYHSGTPAVGLKPQEQIAVVEKGERIMTEEQQRREKAQQRQAGGGRDLRQVLAFGDSEVAAAMAGAAGEDVTVTHLRRNAPLLKQLVRD